jgi:hypothetical protein
MLAQPQVDHGGHREPPFGGQAHLQSPFGRSRPMAALLSMTATDSDKFPINTVGILPVPDFFSQP